MVMPCLTCGTEMQVKQRGRKPKYCSVKCKPSAHRKLVPKTPRACRHCLTIFFTKGSAIFCSSECRVAAYKAAHSNGRHLPVPPAVRTCAGCGVQFIRKPKTDNRRKSAQAYCTKACSWKANRAHKAPRSSNRLDRAPAFSACRVSFTECQHCGLFFSSHYPRRYCSDRCQYVGAYLKATGRDMTPRPCGWCGVIVTPEVGTWRHKFCSLKCSAKYYKKANRKRNNKARHDNRRLRKTLGILGTGVELRELPAPLVEAAKALRTLRQEIYKQWNPVAS